LLATKLHRPRRPVGFVPRQRLIDRLEESLAERQVFVCAPAGFGKTSLLADWAGQSRWPVAWLSLDRGDNDPSRFWRHVPPRWTRPDRGSLGSWSRWSRRRGRSRAWRSKGWPPR
jgi:hypothetical protein